MRLRDLEKNTIKNIVKSIDASARVYLYGSRVDDSLSGGDIDLLVISEKISFSDKITILIRIKEIIGEQKIDLLVKPAKDVLNDPFVKSIMNTAIEL